MPCHRSLDCVFPVRFTQCGCVWFTHTMPCPCCAPTVLRRCRSESDFSRSRKSTAGALRGMIQLAWAAERRPVSDLPRFGFFRLLRGHSRRFFFLTRKLLPFGMCWIVLMTMGTADCTEYELPLNWSQSFFCCYAASPLCIFLFRQNIPVLF